MEPNLNSITIDLISQFVDVLRDKNEAKKLLDNISKTKGLSRQQSIKALSSEHENENLVLVLGAGVSVKYGLPDWYSLLQKLMIKTIEEEQKVSTVLSKLFTNVFNPTPLIAGRYLQNYFEDKNESFEEYVRVALYQYFNIENESGLMDEIVNFCVASGTYPNLDSVITYNFDDILEQRLSKIQIPIRFMPIYGLGMQPGKNLPIYHVHGYLPQKGEITSNNIITFGESIYHEQYYDTYSWNNIVQINKFRDKTCLFIGSSITDPNIRRLLDIAQKQKGNKELNHYTFKQHYKVSWVQKKLKEILNENAELLDEKILAELTLNDTVKFLIDIVEKFEESDMKSLGINTIWVKEWDELPEILREIRETE
ncbi:SIR2 family protein [Flammeovirga sp. EKP202]|uniref:SIR2 family protein n=1 Tax=Flammeovirga sp. EKP202 TaxID=2770592 RepID=UPI00165FD928|nr:SIR2 family protein [Flammeovirga sp. EKP202]MBD0405474.1 SIR2 family protein [Flammeovirga sp. EKP202]